nr:cell division initiation protein [Microbacterium testaceum]
MTEPIAPESDDRRWDASSSPRPTEASALESLLDATDASDETAPVFPVGFRGYDRDAVDDAVRELGERARRAAADAQSAKLRAEAMFAQQRAEHDQELEEAARLHAEQVAALQEQARAAAARAAEAETRVAALSNELTIGRDGEERDPHQERRQFDAILRVAEEQASVLVQNAVAQAERLLDSARDEAASIRDEAIAEQTRLRAEAQHDADQVRLRVETEATAHAARLEREQAHAAERIAQAEQEAVAIRTESERGAAALRSMVSRETGELRAAAERDVREMTARVLEFEESLTRRQDEAQQEFLVLHNQAVAHAERITADATEQVSAALEHARRIGARADDFERLARAQAQQVEADAHVRAREVLDDARDKAQRIADTISAHSVGVLRDAEDRTRDLRWQQQQLASFLTEMNELLRAVPRGTRVGAAEDGDAETSSAGETNAEAGEHTAEDAVEDAASTPSG